MTKVLGPFIYASAFINPSVPGENDAAKTDILIKELISEIEKEGSCVEDVIAVQKYFTSKYDNASTREIYSKYFKPIMPSLTGITYDSLECEGGTADDTCKYLLVAVKGCSKGESYEGVQLDRVVFPSGSPLESVMGYSRAVKAGPFVFVGGTTSVLPDKTVFGEGSSEKQDEFIWKKITDFAEKAGASKDDIVFVKKWVMPEYKSSGKDMPVEGTTEPLTKTVPISKLTRDGQLEEVELCAVIGIAEGKVKKEFGSFFDAF